jgi:hypothetical protein
MWIYSTNNEMVNVAHAEKIELRQETNLIAAGDSEPTHGNQLTGMSIIAHFPDNTESQLAFIPVAPNYDLVVTRYWNAIRTAIKARAEICDLMDIM